MHEMEDNHFSFIRASRATGCRLSWWLAISHAGAAHDTERGFSRQAGGHSRAEPCHEKGQALHVHWPNMPTLSPRESLSCWDIGNAVRYWEHNTVFYYSLFNKYFIILNPMFWSLFTKQFALRMMCRSSFWVPSPWSLIFSTFRNSALRY